MMTLQTLLDIQNDPIYQITRVGKISVCLHATFIARLALCQV